MSTSFLAKYRDPRWQRIRLEVMQEAGFQCQECYSETETLNVHHRLYRKGADPWEYDLDELVCLCHNCHQYIHQIKTRLNAALAYQSAGMLDYLVGYAEASLCEGPEGKLHIASALMAEGIADVFGIQLDEVIDICVDNYVSVEILYDLKFAAKKKSK